MDRVGRPGVASRRAPAGVYLLGKFDGPPPAAVDPVSEAVIYMRDVPPVCEDALVSVCTLGV